MIDRDRLPPCARDEETRFVDLHPRSAALADRPRGPLLAGVPMPWMTRWPGASRSSSTARRAPARRRRRPRVRRPLPRRHRRDDGPRAPAGHRRAHRPGPRGITTMLPVRRRRLGRRGAGPPVRPAVVAAGDVGHRRQPVRAALRPPPDRPAEDRGHGLVLPRHRRRDPRRARRRPGGPPPRRARARRSTSPLTTAVVPFNDARRPRPAAGRGRRRLPADGAGPDQHRDRPARGRLPRRGPRDHPAARRAAGHRRDPHPLRRSRAAHRRLGARPRPAGRRQADRRRRAGGGVRHDRGGRPTGCPARCSGTRSTSPGSVAPSPATPWRSRPSAPRCPRACATRTSPSRSRSPSGSPRASRA